MLNWIAKKLKLVPKSLLDESMRLTDSAQRELREKRVKITELEETTRRYYDLIDRYQVENNYFYDVVSNFPDGSSSLLKKISQLEKRFLETLPTPTIFVDGHLDTGYMTDTVFVEWKVKPIRYAVFKQDITDPEELKYLFSKKFRLEVVPELENQLLKEIERLTDG